MATFIDSFIKQNKETFSKYKKYIRENEWVNEPALTIRKELYELENNLINSVTERDVKFAG